LIEYALSSNDSLRIDSLISDEYVRYNITIANAEVELLGRLPIHLNGTVFSDGVSSEYVLWVNTKQNLPYKFQRTLPSNTMVDEISNLKTNNLNVNTFAISNYVPKDMPSRWDVEENHKDDLTGSSSINWKLCDLDNQYHSLEDITSKVCMINLTSMHCGACGLSVQYLNELNHKYKKEDFSFVSLFDEKEKKGLPIYIKQHEIKYSILLVDKPTLDFYNINLVPTFLILDKNRTIRSIIYGYKKGKTETEIENAIKGLL
jgi:hypothetical protein